MSITTLPAAFKFKASEDAEKNIKFILMLISNGFETVIDKDDFISNYVLSNDFSAYAVEENKIVIHGSDECFNNDDAEEVFIGDFNLDEGLPSHELNILETKKLINQSIKALQAINPSTVTANQRHEIYLVCVKMENINDK